MVRPREYRAADPTRSPAWSSHAWTSAAAVPSATTKADVKPRSNVKERFHLLEMGYGRCDFNVLLSLP
jgi:hypothetical protein